MILTVLQLVGTLGADGPVRRSGVNPVTGMSQVVVTGEIALWYTSRIVAAPDSSGQRVKGVVEQTHAVLRQLDDQLGQLNLGDPQVVRLNVTVVSEDAGAQVRSVLEDYYPGERRPVVTLTGGQMPESDVLISMDAVGVLGDPLSATKPDLAGLGTACPAGPKVFISGKAAQGNLAVGTRDTLKQIDDNLKHLGLSKADIVQLRGFVMPLDEIDSYYSEIKNYFGDVPVPAVTFTHWISSGYLVEIEAVVKDTSSKPATEIEFITPPGETASPVYCRVCRVPAGPLIYTTGLTGEATADSKQQVSQIFDQLKPLLAGQGSDLRHMAKATYFCADDASSVALNALRPTLYDPKRPPAASKAIVPHVGFPGRAITLDMIAVPSR